MSYERELTAPGTFESLLCICVWSVVEVGAALLIAAFALDVVYSVGWRNIPGDGKWPILGWLLLLGGAALLAWVEHLIWRPRVTALRVSRGGMHSQKYACCSTHPSYVLVDLVTLPLWLFGAQPGTHGPLYSAAAIAGARAGDQSQYLLCILTATVLVMIAVSRLAAWYPFGRRVPRGQARRAWLPPVILVILVAIFWAGVQLVHRGGG